MLLLVLCRFRVTFGKSFSKIISTFSGFHTLNNGGLGITAIAATSKIEAARR